MNQQQKIIIQAFGMQSVAVGLNISERIAGQTTEQNIYKSRIPQGNPPDEAKFRSQLGTPVWDTLIFKSGSYIDDTFGQTDYNEMRFDSCLISLTQAHNVVLTSIQGGGDVIEYVGKSAFRINIKGGVFGSGNVRPKSDIVNMNLLFGSNQPLIVKSCGFLSEWNITDFVIENKSIAQSMGGYNYQLFEIDCIQDIPVILAKSPNA